MANQQSDRLEPLRQLAEGHGDVDVLELVTAMVDVLEKDTALVLDQTHIARDIAARTKSGDWFGNTELSDIMSDADHYLRVYKQQREEIARLKATLRDKQTPLSPSDVT
jgi:hypothetical protein